MKHITIVTVVFLGLLLLPVTTDWAQSASTNQPPILAQVGFDQHLGAQIPLDAQFRDSEGHLVRLSQYFGKRPVILTLVYYECPMLCTLVLNGLVAALKPVSLEIGRDYDIVTISFNYRETHVLAATKKEGYVKALGKPGAEAGWHFHVGETDAIDRVASAAGFRFVYDPESQQYAHASGIMVLTPQGKLSHYFYGVEYSARDLQLALVEAGQGKIGSPVDKFLLFCYHYDPSTGKYGLVVTRVVQIACFLTVGLLAAFVLVMLKRDRRTS